MDREERTPRASFATTRWSLVERARAGTPGEARAALEELCAAAWYPLYAYARRRGLPHEEAADAAQGFFAEFLEHRGFARATRERGRLRAFLLGAFQLHLAGRAQRARAEKHGGARTTLSLDLARAEERFRHEPADPRSPERLYEAAWARGLLARVLTELAAEHASQGKAELFAALEGELAGETTPPATLAARLGTTPGAAKVAAHRLRALYRERLRRAILATLEDPREFEEELAALLAAVAREKPGETP